MKSSDCLSSGRDMGPRSSAVSPEGGQPGTVLLCRLDPGASLPPLPVPLQAQQLLLFTFPTQGFEAPSLSPPRWVILRLSFLSRRGSVCPSVHWDSASETWPPLLLVGSVSGGLCVLRQQTWGNRLYFSSFPVPVLEDPTYVGPEGIPRVLGAEGAAVSCQENPSWEVGRSPWRRGWGGPGEPAASPSSLPRRILTWRQHNGGFESGGS